MYRTQQRSLSTTRRPSNAQKSTVGPGRNSRGFLGDAQRSPRPSIRRVSVPSVPTATRRPSSSPFTRTESPEVPDSEDESSSAIVDHHSGNNDEQFQVCYQEYFVPVGSPPARRVSQRHFTSFSHTASESAFVGGTHRRRSVSAVHSTRAVSPSDALGGMSGLVAEHSRGHPSSRSVQKKQTTFKPANLSTARSVRNTRSTSRQGATRADPIVHCAFNEQSPQAATPARRSRVPENPALSITDAIAQSLSNPLATRALTFRPNLPLPATPAATPAKRPRGRPRKNPLAMPTPGTRDGLRDTAKEQAKSVNGVAEASVQPVVKRPPGRPRKSAPASLPFASTAPAKRSADPPKSASRSRSKSRAGDTGTPFRPSSKVRPSTVARIGSLSAKSSTAGGTCTNLAIVSVPSGSSSRSVSLTGRVRSCAGRGCFESLPPLSEYRFALCASCRAKELGEHWARKVREGEESESPSTEVDILGNKIAIQNGWASIVGEGGQTGNGTHDEDTVAPTNTVGSAVERRSVYLRAEEEEAAAPAAGQAVEEEGEREKEQQNEGKKGIKSSEHPNRRPEKRKDPPSEIAQFSWTLDRVKQTWQRAQPKLSVRSLPSSIVQTWPGLNVRAPSALPRPPQEYQTSSALCDALAARVAEGARVQFKGSWAVVVDPERIIDELLAREIAEDVARRGGLPVSMDRSDTIVVLRGSSASVQMPCECVPREGGLRFTCNGRLDVTIMETEKAGVLRSTKGLRILVEVIH